MRFSGAHGVSTKPTLEGEDSMRKLIHDLAKTRSWFTKIGLMLILATLVAIFGPGGIYFPQLADAQTYYVTTCSDCHKYPPQDAPATRGTPTGAVRGNHQKHVSTLGLLCTACHVNNGSTYSHRNGTITMVSPLNGDTGTYSKTTFSQTNAPALGTCSAVYCHGNYTGANGAAMTPAWGSTVSCGGCHLATSATPPTTGSHQKHAGSWTTSNQLACTKCHGLSSGIGTIGHQNLNVQWAFDTTDARMSSAKYKGAAVGSTGGKAPSAVYGSCSTVYCHSNVQNDGGTVGTAWATPTWGSSGSAACGTCHPFPQVTGKHTKHLSFLGTTAAACQNCHAGAGDETIYHARGTINLAIATTYYGLNTAAYSTGNHGPGTGYGNCQNVYCHGSWNTSGTTGNPTWTTVGGPSQTCGNCHSATSATPPNTGSHMKHAGAWTTANQLACTKCHGATNGSGVTGHQDLSVQWAFEQTDARLSTIARYKGAISGSTGAKARSIAYGSCSSIYCHSNVQAEGGVGAPTAWSTPTWGSSGSAGCGTCHAFPQNSGKHTKHLSFLGTTAAACQNCHAGAGDETIYHARGTINMVISTIYYYNLNTATYSLGNHAPRSGYGQCNNVSCHAGFLNSGGTNTNPAWATSGATGIVVCGSCHLATSANPPLTGSHQKHAGSWTTSNQLACTKCHGTVNGNGTIGHQDNNVQWALDTTDTRLTNAKYKGAASGSTGAKAPSVSYGSCSSVYCHSNVQNDGGTVGTAWATPTWGSSGSAACGTCHPFPQVTGKHTKHLSFLGTTAAACQNCHAGAGDETIYHARGTINLAIGTAYYGINTAGGWYTATYSTGNHGPGTGYGNCSNVYCHGRWNTSGTSGNPTWTTVGGPSQTCGNCHSATSATPPNTGSHMKHAGSWSTAINLACTKCHGPVNGAGVTGHQDLSVQWSFDQTDVRISTIARYKGAISGSTGAKARSLAYGSCSSIYCHSNVQQEGGVGGPTAWATPTWGSSGSAGCGTCHAFPASSGRHTQHLALYGTTAAVCQTCHNGAGDETAYHARGTINVRINTVYWGITTALYSLGEHKGGSMGYGNCSATLCHGGPSPNWGTPTVSYTCTKCHGATWGSSGSTQAQWASVLYKAAPGADAGLGHDTWGSTGTVSGGVSNNPKVGAHDTHLRGLNTISLPISCNQCHLVPTVPNTAGHNDTASPGTITWGSLANLNTTTPIIGWNTVSKTCSEVYCHGNRLKNGDTAGANRTPAWTTGAYLVSPVWSQQSTMMGGCGTCHGAPPNSVSTSHTGKVFPGGCNQCHKHININGSIDTISLHINGSVEASGGDCTGCHAGTNPKTKFTGNPMNTLIRQIVGTGGDFNMSTIGNGLGSRHLYGANTILKWDCTVCHREGQIADGGPSATYHNDATGQINLRNVDTTNEAVGWTINNKEWVTQTYIDLDNFCVTCHDANGAAAVYVNATNDGLSTGGRALTPFNTSDLASGYIEGSTWSTTAGAHRTRVINVKDQFYPGTTIAGVNYNGNPSQHAVLGQRYSTQNASWTAATWASYILRKTKVNVNVSREASLLTCADCHVLDSGGGAHAGAQKYNMIGTSAVSNFCWRCHASTVYSFGASAAGSRVTHQCIDNGNITAQAAYGLTAGTTASCFLCHASWQAVNTVARAEGYGGIHGSWSSTAWYSAAGQKTAYRFFPGALFKLSPGAADGNWNSGSGAAGACYMQAATDGFGGGCSRHYGSGGGAVSTTFNYNRPVKY